MVVVVMVVVALAGMTDVEMEVVKLAVIIVREVFGGCCNSKKNQWQR